MGKAKGGFEELVLAAVAAAPEPEGSQLHVFERDRFVVGEEAPGYDPFASAEKAERAIRAHKIFSDSGPVFDVILVEEDEWWFGQHEPGPLHRLWPGGKFRLQLPEAAPSRAYLKLEEGLAWSGAPLAAGDVVLELGSAPGGASYSLLQRGLSVTGVDPGEMDRFVLRHPKFRHLRKVYAEIRAEEMPANAQWIVCDIHTAPKISLPAIDNFVKRAGPSLLGVLVTLKLNDWELAAHVPWMMDYLRKMGMSRVRAAQLSTNKQEIFAYGLTPAGLARNPG
jgi:23S rRNA (cytidine2498-2'-O)-methyltransferase